MYHYLQKKIKVKYLVFQIQMLFCLKKPYLVKIYDNFRALNIFFHCIQHFWFSTMYKALFLVMLFLQVYHYKTQIN